MRESISEKKCQDKTLRLRWMTPKLEELDIFKDTEGKRANPTENSAHTTPAGPS